MPGEGRVDATHIAEETLQRTYAHMSSFLHSVPFMMNADPAKLRLAAQPCFSMREKGHGPRRRGGKERGTGCVQALLVFALGTVPTLNTLERPAFDVCVSISGLLPFSRPRPGHHDDISIIAQSTAHAQRAPRR